MAGLLVTCSVERTGRCWAEKRVEMMAARSAYPMAEMRAMHWDETRAEK